MFTFNLFFFFFLKGRTLQKWTHCQFLRTRKWKINGEEWCSWDITDLQSSPYLYKPEKERNYVNVHVCLQQQRSAPGVHLFLYMSTQSQHRRFLMHCRETAGLKCRSFYPSLNQIVKVSDLLQRTAGAFLPTPPVSQWWREHTSLNSSNRSCQATPTSHESQRRPEYKMWN